MRSWLAFPDGNGADLIAKLREMCPGFTALILSYPDSERQRGCHARDAVDRPGILSEIYGGLPGTRPGV